MLETKGNMEMKRSKSTVTSYTEVFAYSLFSSIIFTNGDIHQGYNVTEPEWKLTLKV